MSEFQYSIIVNTVEKHFLLQKKESFFAGKKFR